MYLEFRCANDWIHDRPRRIAFLLGATAMDHQIRTANADGDSGSNGDSRQRFGSFCLPLMPPAADSKQPVEDSTSGRATERMRIFFSLRCQILL